MAQTSVSFLDGMQGTLKELAIGLGTDVHLKNVRAHVKNGLYHAERTPKIDAAAARLLSLAEEFGQRHGSPAISQQAKDERDQHLASIEAAYLALRKLLEEAEPSAVSRALGG